MAWYDTIVDIGAGDSKQQQTTIIKPPSLGEYTVSGTNLSRSTAGRPSFKDIGEAGFQNYAALQAYWKYYLNSVGRMRTGTMASKTKRKA